MPGRCSSLQSHWCDCLSNTAEIVLFNCVAETVTAIHTRATFQHCTQVVLQPADCYMVLCSDGIYEFMTNDEIMALVHERALLGSQPSDIAQHLVNLLLHCLHLVKGCNYAVVGTAAWSPSMTALHRHVCIGSQAAAGLPCYTTKLSIQKERPDSHDPLHSRRMPRQNMHP